MTTIITFEEYEEQHFYHTKVQNRGRSIAYNSKIDINFKKQKVSIFFSYSSALRKTPRYLERLSLSLPENVVKLTGLSSSIWVFAELKEVLVFNDR